MTSASHAGTQAAHRVTSARWRWPTVGLGVAVAAYCALQLWLTRGTTVFVDETTMFIENRGLRPSVLFTPFNEHLELARRLLYAVGLDVSSVGTTFVVARVVEAAAVAALAWVIFAFLRARIGAVAALAPTVLLLFFGTGWELGFVISGIGNVLAMATGIAALLLITRPGRRSDLAACGLLVVSVLSFTTGVAFAIGALVAIGLAPGWRRRVWITVTPLVIFAAWTLWLHFVYRTYDGETQHLPLSNLLLVPITAVQQAEATAGALFGLNHDFSSANVFAPFQTSSDYGAVIAGAAALLLACRLRRPARPMLWALVATLIFYWIELAVGSGAGRSPDTARYTYAAATLAVLIAAEAWGSARTSRRALVVIYGVSAVALLGNAARLRDGMQLFRASATASRARLGALDIAAQTVRPGFTTPASFVSTVQAGPYLAAVARYGPLGYSGLQLAAAPESLRLTADQVLVAAERIQLVTLPHALRTSACRSIGAAGTTDGAGVPLGPPGVAIVSAHPATAFVARYSQRPDVAAGSLPASRPMVLAIPVDRSRRPWRLAVRGGAVGTAVCRLTARR